MQHRHHADGEIAGDAARNLEEAQRRFRRGLGVPLGQLHHVLDAGAHRVDVLHVAGNAVAGEHISQRRILPAGDKDGQVLLRRGQ